jgi:hypothetical protein
MRLQCEGMKLEVEIEMPGMVCQAGIASESLVDHT